MEKNLGGTHRALRFILGIVVAAVGAFAHFGALWRAVTFAVAIVLIATVFTGVCPLCSVLRIGTRKGKKPRPG